jgi:hypothetical protein
MKQSENLVLSLKIKHLNNCSSLVYRSQAEVQKILDFRCFFAVAAFIPPVTGRGAVTGVTGNPELPFSGRLKAAG